MTLARTPRGAAPCCSRPAAGPRPRSPCHRSPRCRRRAGASRPGRSAGPPRPSAVHAERHAAPARPPGPRTPSGQPRRCSWR
eukprot:11184919-Lingulodinium_polyedra.AAC.1